MDGAVAEDGGVYIAFGEAQGEMNGALVDVHGAGAQRSDPKSGNADDYPQYWGPQGDVRYVYNYVRSVRTTDVTESSDTNYTNVYNFVNRFYVEVLNREGEPGGQEYWTNSLLAGESAGSDVARGFIFSQEFINRGLSDAQFLTILYESFFNRDPDSGGYNYWIDKMNNGTSQSEILDGFFNSSEFSNLCTDYGILPVR